MYKLKRKLYNLKPDLFINNEGDMLYSFKEDDKLYFNEDIICSGEIFSYRLYNKSIYISKKDEKILKHDNIVKKTKTNAGFFVIDEYKVLFNIYSDDYSKQFYKMYNFLEEKEYWTIEKYFGSFIKDNNFLYASCFNNRICKIDLDHPDQPLWQFDLSQLGTFQDYHNEQQSYKVEKILGIHNERLYVALNGSMLLELDIATGKITHKWHHLPEKYKEYPDDDFSARLFDLDKAHNALVCLSGRRYDSIDLQTKEYNSVYIGEELKKYDIVSIRHQGDFTNEHISAIAHLKNDTWFQDGIVMFNRKTNKIDFFYKDETFTTGTATPKLAGNKLYQLDLDGNLYIFEKEEKAQV